MTRSKLTVGGRGFTLIEMLVVLLIFSLLSIMSYRGLSAILDAREHVTREADKWQRVTRFFTRFEQDISVVLRRPVRTSSGTLPAWQADPNRSGKPYLEFSRATASESDNPFRLAYLQNDKQEIEMLMWPSLDLAPGIVPQRYAVLSGVARLELKYLSSGLVWVDSWPEVRDQELIPRAVEVRLVLTSGEEIVRVFAL